jgi:4-hydroxythreonine-4-phosphate dehydrogenase
MTWSCSEEAEMRPIAITMGDPAGIGPEILIKACAELPDLPLVAVAHPGVLECVAQRLGLRMPPRIAPPPGMAPSTVVVPGTIAAAHGAMAAACIEAAIAGTLSGTYAGLVTCPISKQAVQAAGVPFPGHTEWLAARCGIAGERMLLYAEDLAVALVTVHQSLASVPGAITTARVVDTALLLDAALRRLRGRAPRLAVLGINPHAGEGGLFGHEDAVVAEAVAALRQRGIAADGPLPPDTAFTSTQRARYDGHVCMYHDQGLTVFKALRFDQGVNVTLGLPIVRTSVDHGTAFDRAWQGTAEHASLVAAIRLAVRLADQTAVPRA